MKRYYKTYVAALAAAAVALQAALTDNAVTNQEWLTVFLAALAAVGVYAVPYNAPESE